MQGREARLRLRRWQPASPRAGVVVVHGLGDHGLRYGHLAEALAAADVSVAALDLQGHGESEGRRGDIEGFETFAADLASAVALVRADLPEGAPLVVVGHSMGGLVALRYLQGDGRGRPGMPGSPSTFGSPRGVTGAVLSAPWLGTAHPIPRWKRTLGELLLRVVPHWPFRGGVTASQLTRDPAMRRAREEDPLIHDVCSPRLFRGVEEAQQRALDEATGVKVPVLLLVPEADPVADPRAAARLVRRLPAGGCTVVQFPGGLHEPFHDIDRDDVVRRVTEWVVGRGAGGTDPQTNTQGIG